jgi:phenylpropionate dioxygenase-like ring-hydroxylating dioxygenase large terminal subunit
MSDTAPDPRPAPAPEAEAEAEAFNWRGHWAPVVFSTDLPEGKPYGFALYGEPLVLFRDEHGQLACFPDRCPHRAVRLSEGRVVGSRLECLYHGWQFEASGRCAHIPQWPADKALPEGAALQALPTLETQGLVWVWPGPSALAEATALPSVPALDQAEVFCVDYAIDLPYDQSYLHENLIDVAHIHVVHDGLRGGGKREMALPLEFQVLENSAAGIRAQFRSLGLRQDSEMTRLNSASVDFVAPHLIHYTSHYKNPALIAGLALYSLPMGPGRCRLLYRKYSNFYPWRERAKPRWLEHRTQNTILKQDMALIVGQYADIERSGQELKSLWLPLKTLDTLVVLYRKWLDAHAATTPFHRGFASHRKRSDATAPEPSQSADLFQLHTLHCSACRLAHRRAQSVKVAAIGVAVGLVPLMLISDRPQALWAAAAYAMATLAALGAHRFKKMLE